MKIAVDAMGGDFAPLEIIKGCCLALENNPSLQIVLYGDKNLINPILEKNSFFLNQQITIKHTPHFLTMDDKNIRDQLKTKPNASLFLAFQGALNDEVEGVVSAGATQALVLAGHLILKKMPLMQRIAIAPMFKSFDNRIRILLDAGANVELKPQHLLTFAHYATIVAYEILAIKNPQVKLLNIGKEFNKGRSVELETYSLLSQAKYINFGGNEEPQNMLNTSADILLSDGFTANIALKTYEGTVLNFMKNIKQIMTKSLTKKIITKLCFQKELQKLQKQVDPREIGGAMLLGLNKVVIKAHGSSQAYPFCQAILQAQKLISAKINQKITKILKNQEL
ncbi:phosphate acyltransferase PlsX [Candidatus Phytoplasma solani]|uniref:Phosphate acyltransferase n=1 Tax=Candidatus Phytoplasma solani TaxID=69896 RepID=A0A421NYV2_9MOLU|nr:phosphate acyltransferase PlsX [Candidatus Phytoplasma solani]RMI89186.1 glycerol-3-phosphate acyltransferase PlsX [Candidatus Phytoplasma solani]RMI89204.1 glycerol-3-phosphate acyltransferase PlsX [Candidatus Phytoplasma solani]CCP87992.1 Phosphate-acyl-ACP acyltransferase [Candidatus Phytoplasma solani]CCP88508.1 putative glycerol-3-phosphate acyltransferase PlsX [Candidatus Phytoplasma solani]